MDRIFYHHRLAMRCYYLKAKARVSLIIDVYQQSVVKGHLLSAHDNPAVQQPYVASTSLIRGVVIVTKNDVTFPNTGHWRYKSRGKDHRGVGTLKTSYVEKKSNFKGLQWNSAKTPRSKFLKGNERKLIHIWHRINIHLGPIFHPPTSQIWWAIDWTKTIS